MYLMQRKTFKKYLAERLNKMKLQESKNKHFKNIML